MHDGTCVYYDSASKDGYLESVFEKERDRYPQHLHIADRAAPNDLVSHSSLQGLDSQSCDKSVSPLLAVLADCSDTITARSVKKRRSTGNGAGKMSQPYPE